MTDRRDELINLTHQFVDAFNRMSLDDVAEVPEGVAKVQW